MNSLEKTQGKIGRVQVQMYPTWRGLFARGSTHSRAKLPKTDLFAYRQGRQKRRLTPFRYCVNTLVLTRGNDAYIERFEHTWTERKNNRTKSEARERDASRRSPFLGVRSEFVLILVRIARAKCWDLSLNNKHILLVRIARAKCWTISSEKSHLSSEEARRNDCFCVLETLKNNWERLSFSRRVWRLDYHKAVYSSYLLERTAAPNAAF